MTESVEVLFRGDAVPVYAHPGDAGADLVSTEDLVLGPGERALVGTGVSIALPDGYAAFVVPRSGLATKHGITVREVNLYDLSVEILTARGVWDRVLQVEPDQDKDDFREMLQGMLDPQLHIAPAIRAKIEDGEFDIFFLTGIGEVFPYIRSHNVLNNLQSVVTGKPMLMFFPGRYEQSDTLGSSLVLFGRLKDDQYYRAKNILEQEA